MKKSTYKRITITAGLSTIMMAGMLAAPSIALAEASPLPSSPTSSLSDPARKIAEAWYKQLILEGKNEASFSFDNYVKVEFKDAYRELLLMDSPDTLFDGEALEVRGDVEFSFNNGEYIIAYPNGYDMAEADRLTTEWAAEILNKAGEGATDREKMYAVCDFIRSIYTYAYEDLETGIFNDFVSEYYDDGKIVCGQFSAVTHLIANKLGIDCHIMESYEHAYNIVRLDDDPNYIILDLTGSRYGFVDSADESQNIGLYNMEKVSELSDLGYVIRVTVNEGKAARPADASEIQMQREYYLTHGYPVEVEAAPEVNTNEIIIEKNAIIAGLIIAAILILKGIVTNVNSSIRRNRRRRSKLYALNSVRSCQKNAA